MKLKLTNKQREILGLEAIEDGWEAMHIKAKKLTALANRYMIAYLDGDTIVKVIEYSDTFYYEYRISEKIDANAYILSKTAKGKPKKIGYNTISRSNPLGVYFKYDSLFGSEVIIANHSSEKTFYSTYFENIMVGDYPALLGWLKEWEKNFIQKDADELHLFKKETKKQIAIKEGDFFCFKVDKDNFGFGRVLLDIRALIKDKSFCAGKNYGLCSLMAQPLLIKIYHIISPTKTINLEELKLLKAMPAQYIMDNRLFYGDFEIVGNLALELDELDFPISYNNNRKMDNKSFAYLQYGLIYLATYQPDFDQSFNIDYSEYLKLPETELFSRYQHESIGFNLRFKKATLEKCIAENSNLPYWENSTDNKDVVDDLRNPLNDKHRQKIFDFFGLDYRQGYAENFRLFLQKNQS